MNEHEIWLTRVCNEHFAGLANTVLGWFHYRAADPAHPWENWIVMELLVVLVIVLLAAAIRASLSVDTPGKLQHIAESLYIFLRDTAQDTGIHHPEKFIPFFGVLFIFVLFCNLIGIIPGFESPTMFPSVPAGCAIATFAYYNIWGIRTQGPIGYLKHFMGPMWWLAPLMFPIELVSHMARPMSLTIRLFANMFAGEQVTMAFLKLSYLIAPAIFMGLHVFVSFLQAYVFALLTMIYVSSATSHEH